MRLNLDKAAKYRFAVLSMMEFQRDQVVLESSFDSETEARLMFDRQYSKWGLMDTNFYLVDWQEQKLLQAHQVFTNRYTDVILEAV